MDERLRTLKRKISGYNLPTEVLHYLNSLERILDEKEDPCGTTLVATHILTEKDGVVFDWYSAFADYDVEFNRQVQFLSMHKLVPTKLNTRDLDELLYFHIFHSYGDWEESYPHTPTTLSFITAYNYYESVRSELVQAMDAILRRYQQTGFEYVLLDFNLLNHKYDILNLSESRSNLF